MGFLGGLGKILAGTIEGGIAGGCYDGATSFCPKCGMPYQGVCRNCASERSSMLISEGINDIKQANQSIYIDAQKRGYEKASKIYEEVFRDVEEEYKSAKTLLDIKIKDEDTRSDELIRTYKDLVEKRKQLENQCKMEISNFAQRNNLETSSVSQAINSGTMFAPTTGSVFDLINYYKEKKIQEAEAKGYNEVKTLYDKKIAILKSELKLLKEQGDINLQELSKLIEDVLSAISDERMKIASLKVVE